ncbi:MAG TPA: LysM peptidoglycan-binding domain-containing protein, partial [Oscillospiraceae bacterium]|nr:LysM peptidoglycan-binding domain-containing protein [Oscillospiraceae bacterium]
YRFIILPQSESLTAKQKDKNRYENELIEIQTVITSEKEIDSKFTYTNNTINMLSKKYFSEIDQSRFILLINELLEGTDLFVQNIFFSTQRSEGIGDALVESMSVTLPYEGEYSSLLLFLERIRKHNPKAIIQNIDIKIKEKELLSGTILLDFYSLPDLVRNGPAGYLFGSSEINPDPFYSFEDYFIIDDNYYETIDLSGVKINFDTPRILIEGFDNKILNFVPSHPSIKGEIAQNKNSKQGPCSLGLHYSFPPIQDEKHVHIVLNSEKSIILQPPENIGLWVYSYDTTKHGITLGIGDKKGEKHDICLYDNIDWIGWKHLKVDVPQDSPLYPIKIEKIMVDIDSTDDGKGTLLFDALEAFYIMNAPVIDENSIGSYRFYDVQIGDTLNSISKTFYGDISDQDIIKRYNGINSDSDLKPGKIIILPDI